jgi:ornithine carbamoyltransferase
MKNLLRIADLNESDMTMLLDLADLCELHPHDNEGRLEGETVVCYFAKPSTRTRLSFATAITRLGGAPQVVGPAELQLGRGETIEDTARVISSYAKAFVIRTFSDDDVARFAAAASVPVINALTDLHHPCQALADLMTIRQRFGRLAGIKLAFLGAGNNVAHSLIEAGALTGMEIAVACPQGLEPRADIVRAARDVAADTGGMIVVTDSVAKALAGADVVYTDVWMSMGDSESERDARLATLRPFQVNARAMASAHPHAVFMHCLPAHRGEEVTGEVIDGPSSIVFEQAAHRLHTEQALLLALLSGRLTGGRSQLARSG